MWRNLALVFIAATVTITNAQEIATCRNPSGKAFYHFGGLAQKSDSGWTDDKITDGVTTLTKNPDGSVDLLYVDTKK